jgi:hypothetical protein
MPRGIGLKTGHFHCMLEQLLTYTEFSIVSINNLKKNTTIHEEIV